MLRNRQILVGTIALAACAASLAGCGQKGALFLPTEAAAAHRATLPQTLRALVASPPSVPASAAQPATGPASTP